MIEDELLFKVAQDSLNQCGIPWDGNNHRPILIALRMVLEAQDEVRNQMDEIFARRAAFEELKKRGGVLDS